MLFEEITDSPERIRESLRSNYEVWGPPLSLAQYLERESRLHDILTRNGLGHRTFVLINEETDRITAACEVLTRPLYNAGRNLSKDHCLASVFVDPDHRGKGLCGDLLTRVASVFNVDHSNDQLSLWSDVGDYYARFGFMFPPSLQESSPWSWSLICSAPEAASLKTDCETLNAEETLAQITPEHQRLLLREADLFYNECDREIGICAVLPHRGLYEQLQFRALFTAECLGLSPPKTFSARTIDGHGWISWTYMLGSKKLLVLGLFGSANEMALLLATAVREGGKYDCAVELYESSIVEQNYDIEELVAALSTTELSADLVERKTSLPMSLSASVFALPGGYAWY